MKLNAVCCRVLDQLAEATRQLSPQDFVRPAEVLHGVTVGQHLRHTLEFFQCLESGFSSGHVNYDQRAHDEYLQADPSLALAAIERLSDFFSGEEANLRLSLSVSYDRSGQTVHSVESNYFRELIYTIEHAVHHMALMKIGLKEVAPYVRIPGDFGVATSTLRHQDSVLTER